MGKMSTNVLAKCTQVWVSSLVADTGVSSGVFPVEGWVKLSQGGVGIGAVCPFSLGAVGLALCEWAPRTAVMLSLDMSLHPGVCLQTGKTRIILTLAHLHTSPSPSEESLAFTTSVYADSCGLHSFE